MYTLLPELHSIESFNPVSGELEYLLSREHFMNSLTSKQPKVNSFNIHHQWPSFPIFVFALYSHYMSLLTQLFFVYYYYLCYDINCRHTSNCVRVTLDFIYARVDWRSDCAYLAQVRLQYVHSPSYSWHYYTRWTQEHVVGVLTQTKSPRTPK